MMRKLIVGITLTISAVVASAPVAGAVARTPAGSNKGGEVCMWVPILNMGICLPL